MQFRPSWCIVAVALVAQTVQAVPSIVTLPYAKYDGLVLSNGITQWLGMRYAVPPIGNRRFRPPEEPLSETGIQEAKVHRDRCLVTGRPACDPDHSEDCLFINVQAPTRASKHSRLPVFVYLRGDGYNNTLTDANINATGLMVQNDNDFIVVTFNHRLGPYGFLTGDDGMTSNNGIRDQIKALDWVTRFIRRFGGDPEHIVLGGSGIGAQNVLIHLTMQKTYNGHFKGIIAESPPFPPLPSLEQADKQYLEFAKQMGCRSNEYPECKFSDQIGCDEKATLDCLLALSADDMQNAGHNTTLSTLEAPPWDRWLPVIDHDLIIDTTTNNFRNGHFALVPFIIGNAVDTGTAFAHRDSQSTDDVIDYMSDLYPELSPEDLDEINTMYPNTNASCDTPACAYGQISNVFQDSRYVCPALIATQNMKKKEIDGSYLYLWDVDDTFDGPMDPNTRQNIEAAMLWGPVVVDVPDSFKQGRGNDAVPYVKQRYWANFIRSLNPNRQHKFQDFKYSMTAAGKKIRLTLWPQWWAGWRKRVVFGNGGNNRKRDTGYMKWTCTFWNRLSTYLEKYGIKASSGGGWSSACETIARVAAGAVAEKWLREAYGVEIVAFVSSVGKIKLFDDINSLSSNPKFLELVDTLTRDKVDKFLPVRCPDATIIKRMEDMIAELRDQRDLIGGTVTWLFKPPATISQDQTTARYDASGEGVLAAKGRLAALTIADALMAQHARQMGMKIAAAGR
ncbi:hypothetical protein MY5147_000895 [Beauveria neobassiana]